MSNTDLKIDYEKDEVKLPYTNLMLEVTRRCNLKCEHCMRGTPQNIDMSDEILEKILGQVDQIYHLSLTGGEPFLAPHVIEKMVDIIIENKIRVWRCTTVDNGTILNDLGIRSIEALNRLGKYIYENVWSEEARNDPDEKLPISVSISNSIYHKNDIQKAIEFYKSYANEYMCVDDQGEWESGFKDRKGNVIKLKDTNIGKWLKKEGRAKENNLSNAKYTTNTYSVEFWISDDEDKVAVTTGIQICANGNVVLEEALSFESMDKKNMGNVLKEPISCMIHKWNWNEPLTEREVIQYCNNMKLMENTKIPKEKREEYEALNNYLNLKKMLFVEGHKEYPYLSREDLTYIVTAKLALMMLAEGKSIGSDIPDDKVIKHVIMRELSGDYPKEGFTKEGLEQLIDAIIKKNNEAMIKDRGFLGYLKHYIHLLSHDIDYYNNLGVNAYEK